MCTLIGLSVPLRYVNGDRTNIHAFIITVIYSAGERRKHVCAKHLPDLYTRTRIYIQARVEEGVGGGGTENELRTINCVCRSLSRVRYTGLRVRNRWRRPTFDLSSITLLSLLSSSYGYYALDLYTTKGPHSRGGEVLYANRPSKAA